MNANQKAASIALAQWLAVNEPELFAALAARVDQQLAGFTDFLSTIGSGIAKAATAVGSTLNTAAKSVGSFIASPNGMSVLTTLGQTYLQTQAQKNALQVQLAQASAGQMPAPIETRYDAASGAYVPVFTPVAGAPQPLTPQLTQQLLQQSIAPGWQRWLPWIIAGTLGLGFLAWILTRDRS